MRKGLFTSLLSMILLLGCSNEAYHSAIEKGLDYIASEEYSKAEVAFELALVEKDSDDKATALLTQVNSYQMALAALDDGDLELSTEMAAKVMKETDGSNTLIKKAEELISSNEDIQMTFTRLTDEYESARKLFEEDKYADAKKAVDKWLKQDVSHAHFKSLHKDMKELQTNIKKAIEAEEQVARDKEIAEQEAAKKAAAERAAAEEAEAQAAANKKMSANEALAIIKNLNDWTPDFVFELDQTPFNFEGKEYYGIYVYSTIDDSNAGRVSFMVDVITGEVYDSSRGEPVPLE